MLTTTYKIIKTVTLQISCLLQYVHHRKIHVSTTQILNINQYIYENQIHYILSQYIVSR